MTPSSNTHNNIRDTLFSLVVPHTIIFAAAYYNIYFSTIYQHTHINNIIDDLHTSSLIPQRVSQHHLLHSKYFIFIAPPIKPHHASCSICPTPDTNPTTQHHYFEWSHSIIHHCSEKINIFLCPQTNIGPTHTHLIVVGRGFSYFYFRLFFKHSSEYRTHIHTPMQHTNTVTTSNPYFSDFYSQ